MHEHASKMKLGDKETVAICIQASLTCYLHVIHRYTRMVRIYHTRMVRIYHTRMVIPYAYGHTVRVWYTKLYHTRTVHTIRVWYVPYAYGIKYAYGTEQL